jgi:hypothetical protein
LDAVVVPVVVAVPDTETEGDFVLEDEPVFVPDFVEERLDVEEGVLFAEADPVLDDVCVELLVTLLEPDPE